MFNQVESRINKENSCWFFNKKLEIKKKSKINTTKVKKINIFNDSLRKGREKVDW
jgi:hypothetical protein